MGTLICIQIGVGWGELTTLAKIIGFPAQAGDRTRGSKRPFPYHVGFPSSATATSAPSTSYQVTNELRTVQESAVSEGQRSSSPSYNCDPDQNNVVETSQYECQADNWCCTQVNVIKFSYLWTINNFSYCHEELGEVLKSSTFGSSHNDKMRWCLRINPKGLDEESKDFLSLYLLLVQSDKSDVRAKFKFSILNADREESKAMESQRAYKFVQSKDWGFKKFIRREYLLNEENGLLPEDRLSIFCEVSIVTDAVNITGQHTQLPQITIPPSSLSEDYSNLFTESICTDCEIVVDEQVFKAHKAILASRSEVFRAMFSYPTTEKDNNKVVIDDLDPETVKGMLHFIYGDNVPELDHLAIKLMSAADKYQLKRLKQMCEWSLCNAISTSNVCQVMVHADLHCAEQLKARCIAFINQNSLSIVDTEGWKVLAQDYGQLLAQVYKAMATQHMPIAQLTAPPKTKRVRYM
ncbi:unnamed protein product [Bursaphelenchus okinawaensis]|uniref:BTB domain-containing protein n=1 Tax=Bursaphelenchus okinawaensis TaxID=465554 RepID=A0A811KGY7_9BILA|nr:unnamed protein product [Bursaphelenchus okinawaensis]CAG9102949.1 unnamed protein product [Bursaphelenchus okinawaensis]